MSDAYRKSSLPEGSDSPRADLLRARLARELDRTPEPQPVPRIADHQLLQRIGCGSYGDVWLARSVLGTLRAVKIVYLARFKEDRPYERQFQGIVKYEPISRTHEGLLQVLHVGRDDEIGCFFYVMELADDVKGTKESGKEPRTSSSPLVPKYCPRTLASDLAQHERIPAAEAAAIALQLTKALDHLHRRGLVHRDIKPSNVIFVAGKPKLADIGLVTDVGSSRSFVGTEGFIPPEGPGAPQADLYGLGKLLYELATGRDRLDFPQLPARLDQLPDAEALLELNEVVTRACAPAVEDRYASATELEADLNSFLAGRSLRRARNLERYLVRLRKAVAVSCVFLALLAFALWLSRREEKHARETARVANERAQLEIKSRQKETILRLRAEAAERETEQQLYVSLLQQARANLRSGLMGQRVGTLDALKRAAAISNHVDLRTEAIAALALPDMRPGKELPYSTEFNLCLFDPALERVALSHGRGPVEIRSVTSNELLATLPASTNLMTWGGTWSPDGRFLAIKRDYDDGGYHADLEVWEVERSRRILLVRNARFNARAFHPREPLILVSEGEGWISAWNLQNGTQTGRRKFEAVSENLAYSPDGNLVAASYRSDGGWALSVHRAEDSTLLSSQQFTNVISTFAWHPDGMRLAVCDHAGQVHLMNARSGTLQILGRHKAQAATATFSPSGEYLLTGGWERELICWDIRTLQRALTIVQDSYIAQFSSDGKSCALLTPSGVILNDFERPTVHRELIPEMGPRLWNAVFSPDGRYLAAASDSRAGVWDLKSTQPGALKSILPETRLFWSSDSTELLGSSRGVGAFRWRVEITNNSVPSVRLSEVSLENPSGFTSVSLASNRVTWTTLRGSQTTGWEPSESTGEWAKTVHGLNGMSPDGKWLGIYQPYGFVLSLYHLPGMLPIASLTNLGSIAGFNFLPDREELVVASRGHLEFWSMKNWERTRVARDFIGISHIGVLPEPSGRSMWLLKNYQTAGLYNTETLDRILSLPNGMLPLALDKNGRFLAVCLDLQRLLVWDLEELRTQLREVGLDWEDR